MIKHIEAHVDSCSLCQREKINRDSPLPVQKLIKCIEPYKGESMLGKWIEQSQITVSTTAKMLERMQAQKRHCQHQRATHKFQVGDLVLLKNTMLTRWTLDGILTTEW